MVMEYPNNVRKVNFYKGFLLGTQPKSASYGRPRLLTHEVILDGAVKLGLENVTMKKLSNHFHARRCCACAYGRFAP